MAFSFSPPALARRQGQAMLRQGLPAALALLLVALAEHAPTLAQAPAPAGDLARCEQLHARYERYSNPGGESRSGSAFSAAEARAALQECRRGNTAQGIAVLQRKLRALGFKD